MRNDWNRSPNGLTHLPCSELLVERCARILLVLFHLVFRLARRRRLVDARFGQRRQLFIGGLLFGERFAEDFGDFGQAERLGPRDRGAVRA